jgi:hypothetical protein
MLKSLGAITPNYIDFPNTIVMKVSGTKINRESQIGTSL